jgi:phosphotransferase system enzyme I (PtsP)
MARRRKGYAETARLPAETRDGVRVHLHLNAGLLIDLQHLAGTGAEGIGLYRTEVPFMVRSAFPDVAQQTELYSRVLDQAEGRSVLFRTLDVGGDKLLPYVDHQAEENPALGWRAIRIGLDRPAILRTQLRALIRASAGRPLAVMFPMIASAAEFDRARGLLDLEVERAGREGRPLPARLEVGLMLEVPALLWQLPAVLRRADFLSVGSNDLMQYLFAADRGDPRLAGRYDVLCPPALDVLAAIAEAAAAAGVPAGVCGEMAGRPLEAAVLVGLGYRSLSMAPGAIGPVKAAIRALDCGRLADFLADLRSGEAASVRQRLRLFARDHGVPL